MVGSVPPDQMTSVKVAVVGMEKACLSWSMNDKPGTAVGNVIVQGVLSVSVAVAMEVVAFVKLAEDPMVPLANKPSMNREPVTVPLAVRLVHATGPVVVIPLLPSCFNVSPSSIRLFVAEDTSFNLPDQPVIY